MIDIAIFAVLLVLGYGFGQLSERRHYKSIKSREAVLTVLPAVATRYPPTDKVYNQSMVIGSVVVASDYFKSFVASLVNIFGGRVTSFEPLLDRGRREAILRLKEEAKKINAEMVFNVKFETSRIGGRVPTIEVLAYGTALVAGQPSVTAAGDDKNGFGGTQAARGFHS